MISKIRFNTYLIVGVVNGFIAIKRVNNTKSNTNLTVQVVQSIMQFLLKSASNPLTNVEKIVCFYIFVFLYCLKMNIGIEISTHHSKVTLW